MLQPEKRITNYEWAITKYYATSVKWDNYKCLFTNNYDERIKEV